VRYLCQQVCLPLLAWPVLLNWQRNNNECVNIGNASAFILDLSGKLMSLHHVATAAIPLSRNWTISVADAIMFAGPSLT
jgi:hypothetical protein